MFDYKAPRPVEVVIVDSRKEVEQKNTFESVTKKTHISSITDLKVPQYFARTDPLKDPSKCPEPGNGEYNICVDLERMSKDGTPNFRFLSKDTPTIGDKAYGCSGEFWNVDVKSVPRLQGDDMLAEEKIRVWKGVKNQIAYCDSLRVEERKQQEALEKAKEKEALRRDHLVEKEKGPLERRILMRLGKVTSISAGFGILFAGVEAVGVGGGAVLIGGLTIGAPAAIVGGGTLIVAPLIWSGYNNYQARVSKGTSSQAATKIALKEEATDLVSSVPGLVAARALHGIHGLKWAGGLGAVWGITERYTKRVLGWEPLKPEEGASENFNKYATSAFYRAQEAIVWYLGGRLARKGGGTGAVSRSNLPVAMPPD